jgi:hypothetical protein
LGFVAEVASQRSPVSRSPPQMHVDLEEVNRRAEAYRLRFVGPPPMLDD